MKTVALFLAFLAASQAAVWRDWSSLPSRSVLFPRDPQPPGESFFDPEHKPPTIDNRGFCGQIKNSSKIVGGTEARPHEFPWQVGIVIDSRYFCGGSLISNEWILTAAHCADGARSFEITLGDHDRRIPEGTERVLVSRTATVHPGWSSSTLANDIALIRLPSAISFTNEISPICVAPATEPDHVGDRMTVSGWGKDSDLASGTSPVLRKVTVPGISNTQCAQTYGGIITDSILCVDTTDGKGSCNGDSGGPLSFVVGTAYHQVGVVSFGSSQGCEAGLPAGFSRVSSFASWISSVTGLII